MLFDIKLEFYVGKSQNLRNSEILDRNSKFFVIKLCPIGELYVVGFFFVQILFDVRSTPAKNTVS